MEPKTIKSPEGHRYYALSEIASSLGVSELVVKSWTASEWFPEVHDLNGIPAVLQRDWTTIHHQGTHYFSRKMVAQITGSHEATPNRWSQTPWYPEEYRIQSLNCIRVVDWHEAWMRHIKNLYRKDFKHKTRQ